MVWCIVHPRLLGVVYTNWNARRGRTAQGRKHGQKDKNTSRKVESNSEVDERMVKRSGVPSNTETKDNRDDSSAVESAQKALHNRGLQCQKTEHAEDGSADQSHFDDQPNVPTFQLEHASSTQAAGQAAKKRIRNEEELDKQDQEGPVVPDCTKFRKNRVQAQHHYEIRLAKRNPT